MATQNNFSIFELAQLIGEPFEGKSNTLNNFINAVNDAYIMATAEQHRQLFLAIKLKIKGKARELIDSVEIKDWSELKILLIENYGEEIRPDQLCVELQTIKRNKNEKINDRVEKLEFKLYQAYTYKLTCKIKKSAIRDMCEDQALGAFKRGLHNNQIKIIVLANNPKTVSDAIAIAKQEELTLNTENNLAKYSFNSNNPNNSCKICHKNNHSTSSCFFRNNNNTNNSQNTQNFNNNSNKFSNNKNNNKKFCTYCKKNFHTRDECYKLKNSNKNEPSTSKKFNFNDSKQISSVNTSQNDIPYCKIFSSDLNKNVTFMIDSGAQASLIKIGDLPKGHRLDHLNDEEKSSINSFNENKIIFDNNLAKISQSISGLQNITADSVDFENIMITQSLVENNIISLDKTISKLILAIIFSQRNQLHPIVIKPEQFLNEINHILTKIPNNLQVPINVNLDNINEIFKILEIKTIYNNNKLIFKIKLPLSSINNYIIYHIVPIFIPFNNQNQFIHLTKNVKYLFTDNLISHYIKFDSLSNCQLLNNVFVCKSDAFFSGTDKVPICETDLLNNKYSLPSTCDVYISQISSESWYHSYFPNNWYFVMVKDTVVTISCNAHTIVEKIIINKSGMLSLKENCMAITPSVTLEATQSQLESKFELIPLEFSLLNSSCCNYIHNRIAQKPIHLERMENVKLDQAALNKLNEQLSYQERIVDLLANKHVYEFYNDNKFIINLLFKTFGLLLVVVIVYIYIKYCKKKPVNNQPTIELEPLNLEENPIVNRQERFIYNTRFRRRLLENLT
ncbi:MATH and LRR domain-containing protein PFE0570w-like [Daktulosphaira vitifoliae]|uniref:MATH and LRR domain-containing protein PFE0570w-like n=1 Tax=Daktulosphaira vitifoliae TaxID=58002 RepID=UPI0021A9AE93|nr:MATH and LRR domain-containing protein PFE0570w-like [Daktulosphaira vitifoliae]